MDTQGAKLCPRGCGVDRRRARGFLRRAGWHKIARASLHQWEEPSISGTNGSGAIFFLRLYAALLLLSKL